MAKKPRRILHPLQTVLRDLAISRPGTVLSMPGAEDMSVEEWIDYVRLAIIDPRLLPNVRAGFTGRNFFWDLEDGKAVVRYRDPRSQLYGTAFTEVPRPRPGMGADEEDVFPRGNGPWNDILGARTADRYGDFVRGILLQRIRNSVAFLNMTGDQAVQWARCFADASSFEKVDELIHRIVPETLNPAFSQRVDKLLLDWHGSALLQVRPRLLQSLQDRSLSWYIFLSVASEIEEGCGWPVVYTHSKTPDVILMDAVHYAGDGLWAPEVN